MAQLFWLGFVIIIVSCAQHKETTIVEEVQTDTVRTKQSEALVEVDTTLIKPSFDYTLDVAKISTKDELGTIWTDETTSSYRFVASENKLLVYKNREILGKYADIVAVQKVTSIQKSSDPFDWNEITEVAIRKSSGDVIITIRYTQKGLFGDIGEIRYSISDKETLTGDFKTNGPEPLKPLRR